jgi:hypothetical protein
MAIGGLLERVLGLMSVNNKNYKTKTTMIVGKQG